MFSNKSQLKRRTPENGIDRENFLSLLVDEYLNSTLYDAKCQVLANLANFAYDPVNYVYIRDVGVLDIFLYVIKNETNTQLLHFATADPLNADYILRNSGLKPLLALLRINNTDIVTDTITTLIYLSNQQTKSKITIPEVVQIMQDLKMSESGNLANLATIFLQDICGIY
ncbi:armadillo repeat-containing protein 7 isoform X2 [Hyposmocoma kahamanoa]|uniref:armadillo repeat-containing protein 7 isoform X2 n=1 Tax=Hyposmocoma kahamanoa TaxID=1477025 RepID=UPI000E6D8839|nr:armadillo repeat-containing protein 7 isoform X2 [Hyposmocoma kahamanoa]